MCYPDSMSVDAREPITLPPTERDQVRELERMLDLGAPELVSVSGERLVVPPTVYEVLRKVVELMAEGKAVTLLPDNQVVTTQRAADLLGMSRPFFAPPGVAPDRLGSLRRAFDATMLDEGFLADAKQLGMEINPVRGEDVEALVTRIMGTPAALAQRARDALKPQ